MAREIPAAPKIYTTTYDNFRGVDFTNDPTNVWSHRSPNAKNMIPDLSGRPWKRTGWKIVKTAQDFKDVYNTTKGYDPEDADYFTGKVIPQKTSYFELGGEDYLAITNNLGLFISLTYKNHLIEPVTVCIIPIILYIGIVINKLIQLILGPGRYPFGQFRNRSISSCLFKKLYVLPVIRKPDISFSTDQNLGIIIYKPVEGFAVKGFSFLEYKR